MSHAFHRSEGQIATHHVEHVRSTEQRPGGCRSAVRFQFAAHTSMDKQGPRSCRAWWGRKQSAESGLERAGLLVCLILCRG